MWTILGLMMKLILREWGIIIVIFVGGVMCMVFYRVGDYTYRRGTTGIWCLSLNQFLFLSLAILETTVRKIEIVSETVHSSKTEAMDM